MRRRTLGVLVALWAVAVTAGCGGVSSSEESAKSPDAYCEAFFSHAAPLHDKYEKFDQAASDGDLLGSLPALISSPGDMVSLFDSMVPHAPDEIAADTAAARDAFRKLQDNLGDNATDPLGGLATNVVTALTSSGSFEHVGQYLQTHCPMSSAIAKKYVKSASVARTPTATATTTTTTDVATPPDAGTQLASIDEQSDGGGRHDIITNGVGFTLVHSLVDPSAGEGEMGAGSSIVAYDDSGQELATIAGSDFTGECGAADVVVADQRLIITELITNDPAEGIQPPQTSSDLTAWDATTGDEAWTVPIKAKQKGADGCDGEDGTMSTFAATHDGKWGIWRGQEGGTIIIDLATGDHRVERRSLGVLGDSLLARGDEDTTRSLVIDPQTGHKVGTFSTSGVGGGALAVPSGIPESDTAGLSAPVVLSTDGQRVFLLSSRQLDGELAAYSLPGGNRAWKASKGIRPFIVGDAGGVLLAIGDGTNGDDAQLVALDDMTGKRKWAVPFGDVCGMTASQTMVSVNGQLAILDTQTGEQLSYSKPESDGCPDIRPGGINVVSDAGTSATVVTQILKP